MAPTTMSLRGVLLPVLVLLAIGLYQLTPFKSACLSHCRHPAAFLARYCRSGAFALGARHGLFCVGCCWALMALLFVAGVMSALWIVGLALLVAAERLLPSGPRIARLVGLGCCGYAAWHFATAMGR
jgi:predicted metal-binding membrane protein